MVFKEPIIRFKETKTTLLAEPLSILILVRMSQKMSPIYLAVAVLRDIQSRLLKRELYQLQVLGFKKSSNANFLNHSKKSPL